METGIVVQANLDSAGLFEPGHVAFLQAITQLRPSLHRYCTRMTGSALDGEDVMQEAIFEAYQKLALYDESLPLNPWLFRIVRNRCVDFIRRRHTRGKAEAAAEPPEPVLPIEPHGLGVGRAVERLVVHLPAKERACILLKDIFDCSLEEIAELVDSTVGGVKAALSRGRSKLGAMHHVAGARAVPNQQTLELLHLYVERFNRRDWDGVRELASADARLRVADCFAGRLADSPYFTEYERPIIPWRMALGSIDAETVILILRDGATPEPYSAIRIGVTGGQVVSITDYIKSPWVIAAAEKAFVRIDRVSAYQRHATTKKGPRSRIPQ